MNSVTATFELYTFTKEFRFRHAVYIHYSVSIRSNDTNPQLITQI